jgi:hypothetical protein
VTKPVSVVVPSKVSVQTVGSYYSENRGLDESTSPAGWGVPTGYVALMTIFCRNVTVSVADQFNATIGDVYLNASVTEYVSSQWRSINQAITSGSAYTDPVCYLDPRAEPNLVLAGSTAYTNWLSEPLEPLVSTSSDVNPAVKIDGFELSPGLGSRHMTTTPPSSLTITFP